MAQQPARQMKFGAMLEGVGINQTDWLDPEIPGNASVSIDWYIKIAQAVEAARFDLLFLADAPFVPPDPAPHYLAKLEPITLLSALSVATSRIGLVATLSTSFWEPYNAARLFGSLDHISKGRAGWNVVTTALAGAASNYGGGQHLDHDTRYARAREFVEVTQGLWDSYEDDAFPRDKSRGIFVDKTKQHRLDHKGEYFSVAGPLALPRSPQGRPVLFQAGESSVGRNLSAQIADATFQGGAADFESAQAYYADLKSRAAALGRSPESVKVLTAMPNPVIADTDEEARATEKALRRALDIKKLLVQLGRSFNYYDFSQHDLDAPFPDLSGLKLDSYRGRCEWIIRTAREEKLTLREAAYHFDTSRSPLVGSPETVANELQRWFDGGAADGFILQVNRPRNFALFCDRVLPILQKRGLFRTEYEHHTLRGNLGLPVPENRYTQAKSRKMTTAREV